MVQQIPNALCHAVLCCAAGVVLYIGESPYARCCTALCCTALQKMLSIPDMLLRIPCNVVQQSTVQHNPHLLTCCCIASIACALLAPVKQCWCCAVFAHHHLSKGRASPSCQQALWKSSSHFTAMPAALDNQLPSKPALQPPMNRQCLLFPKSLVCSHLQALR